MNSMIVFGACAGFLLDNTLHGGVWGAFIACLTLGAIQAIAAAGSK
jgi:F0F1-type ATP synthase assembly protein I